METLKGYCGDCRKLTTFCLTFVGGNERGTIVRRECVYCEVECDFTVDRDALAHLWDCELDPFEAAIARGETEFYIIERQCYYCEDKNMILVLNAKPVDGQVHIDGLCIGCRRQFEFTVSQTIFDRKVKHIQTINHP